VGGVGDDAADAAEVLGEGAPQRLDADRVAVAEVLGGDGGDRVAQAAAPGGPRERRDVRSGRHEVVADRRPVRAGGCGGRARSGRRHVRDPRPGALAQHQVALRGQLGVGVDGDPPGDAELAGQLPGGRQPGTRAQRAVADRLAQLPLDLRTQRAGLAPGHGEQQVEGLGRLGHRVPPGNWYRFVAQDWICRCSQFATSVGS
jgi:hypothetical protein